MLSALLAAALLAAPETIIWDAGSSLETQHALEAWYRARDRGALPPIRLRNGYPRILPEPRDGAPPANELVVLGACDAPTARHIVEVLQPIHGAVRAAALGLRELRGSCPTLARVEAESVEALIAARGPRFAADAARARARLASCPGAPDLTADARCSTAWGIDCATYAALTAFAAPPPGRRCAFLLGTPRAVQLMTARAGDRDITACVAAADDPAALVFARRRGAVIDFPVDALCGQRPDLATRLGAARPVGRGVCIEVVRAFGDGPAAQRQAGLRCYVPIDAAPFARAVETVDGDSLAYAVVRDTLCLRADGRAPWALRLGRGGFEPTVLPPECESATYKRVMRRRPE